jgi:DNA-binding response OmpR family regulator
MTKIMLIEDDATMLSLLGTLLGMEGFDVARLGTESNAAELVETACRVQPDLVLLDVHIRQISGFDVARQLRQAPELKNIRILMASGLDHNDECLAAGADHFILKPFMPDDLIMRIRALVNK